MRIQTDSSNAAPIDMVAALHFEVTALLLEKLQELRQDGTYDASVVANALKLIKDEDVHAHVGAHPLQKIADLGLLEELSGLEQFATTREMR